VIEAFHFLQHAPNSITSIDFSYVDLSDEVMKYVASSLNHPNLNIKEVRIQCNDQMTIEGVKSFFVEIKRSTRLQYLGISEVDIKDEGCEFLADCLSTNTTLTELHLGSCGIEGKGALCLGESLLNHNTTLRSINLEGNKFGGDEKNIVRIGECFGANSHLIQLSFNGCELREKACDFLGGLVKNRQLHALNLSNNAIKDDGAKAITEIVEKNTNLTKLDLGFCELGSESVRCLNDAITQNTSLLSLVLSRNLIGDEGGEEVANMIKSNISLRELDLYRCGIEEDGIERILESLCKNISLIYLDLDSNSLPSSKEKCEKYIEDASKNKYLCYLGGKIDADFKAKILRIGERNKELWRERIHWSFVLNVMCRAMMLGEWNCCIPPEMICEILGFVPPPTSISEEAKARVIKRACDKSTIGGDKQSFLEFVFGKGIKHIFFRILKRKLR